MLFFFLFFLKKNIFEISYLDQQPQKIPKVEDFITEFDILCAYYNIETQIIQEDGRPFIYEIAGTFSNVFNEQIVESTYLPYDSNSDHDPNTIAISNNNSNDRGNIPNNGNSSEAKTANLNIVNGYLSNANHKCK